MDLFNYDINEETNLLSEGGEVYYYGKFINEEKSHEFFDSLLKKIEWKNDEAFIFGKHFITKRKAAWYGDREYSYTYSNRTKHALPWTAELISLRKLVQERVGVHFNSCLLNLYHSGEESMSWHSDDEKSLGEKPLIASVSLGEVRKFCFKHKENKQKICLSLENGSLLVMKGETQKNWLHRLPPTSKVKEARINLTFRNMVE